MHHLHRYLGLVPVVVWCCHPHRRQDVDIVQVGLLQELLDLVLLELQLSRVLQVPQRRNPSLDVLLILHVHPVRTLGLPFHHPAPGEVTGHLGDPNRDLLTWQGIRHEDREVIDLDDPVALVGQVDHLSRVLFILMNWNI